jgi:hypothetical protein
MPGSRRRSSSRSRRLRKHYFSELKFREVARDRLNANLLTKLWELFMAGNVAAGREFRDVLKDNDLMLFGQTAQPQKSEKPVTKLGKKEAALAAAQNPMPARRSAN